MSSPVWIFRYSTRAKKIGAMAVDQRILYRDAEGFWLRWAAKHGATLRQPGRKYFDFFYRSTFEYLAGREILTLFSTILLLVCAVY